MLYDLICVAGLFYEYKLLVLMILVILSVWGMIRGILKGLEMRYREEKSKHALVGTCGFASLIAPQDSVCLYGIGEEHKPEFPNLASDVLGLRPMPLRAPRTPVHPIHSLSFWTSSYVMYPRFLVDSNTVRNISAS